MEGEIVLDEQLMTIVAKETKVNRTTVQKVIALLDEGNTVPFIARYRKEATGGLDEVAIKNIQDTWSYSVQRKERKEEVIRLIDEQGKLTDDLKVEIEKATKLQRVEDLYRPYRQKRRTRATIAKEKGLEPLADLVWEQKIDDVVSEAEKYFSEEHELHDVETVITGVNDIIAEKISDDPEYREFIRKATWNHGQVITELKKDAEDEKETYKMYYEYKEAIRSLVSHRILAFNRGEKEDVLRVLIEPPIERILTYLTEQVIPSKKSSQCVTILKEDRKSVV